MGRNKVRETTAGICVRVEVDDREKLKAVVAHINKTNRENRTNAPNIAINDMLNDLIFSVISKYDFECVNGEYKVKGIKT